MRTKRDSIADRTGRAARRGVLLIIAAAAAAGCAVDRSAPAANAGEGERLLRVLFEQGLSNGDSTVLAEAVAAEFTFHVGGQSVTMPRQQLWALTRPIRIGFPDIRFTVEDVVADGARVAARISFVGTHRGRWGGIAPTGRQVRVTEMFMCRIEDGLLAECWQEWDEHGLREQLGAGARDQR